MSRTTGEANSLFIWRPIPPQMREDGLPLTRGPLLNPAATLIAGSFTPAINTAEQAGNKWLRSDMKKGEKVLRSCLIADFMGPLTATAFIIHLDHRDGVRKAMHTTVSK